MHGRPLLSNGLKTHFAGPKNSHKNRHLSGRPGCQHARGGWRTEAASLERTMWSGGSRKHTAKLDGSKSTAESSPTETGAEAEEPPAEEPASPPVPQA